MERQGLKMRSHPRGQRPEEMYELGLTVISRRKENVMSCFHNS